MNHENIIATLSEEFPGRSILALPPDNPREIICEIDSTDLHPDHSSAIAYIDSSESHYHLKSVETYIVEEGTLTLTVGGKEQVLEAGQEYTIQPPAIHSARGKATRVRVNSKPGWTLEDHILVKQNNS